MKSSNPHVGVRKDWLSLTNEQAFLPDVPVIDPHHHLWIPGNAHGFAPYQLTDLAEDVSSGHKVVGTVFVDSQTSYRVNGPPALSYVGETEYVAAMLADRSSSAYRGFNPCAGIVSRAELRDDKQAQGVLEAHVEAGKGRFRGIRQISAWHQDASVASTVAKSPPGLLLDSSFRQGFRALQRLNLSFDAFMYFTQLDDLVSLAAAFPEISIVLDHAGGPLGIGPYEHRRAEAFTAWRIAMARVARLPNVSVKLSGLGMRGVGFGLHDRSSPATSADLCGLWAPYFEFSIDAFGPQRCMFASNFPVDKGSTSWQLLWNAHKKIACRYSDGERDAMLAGNASRIYRLSEPGPQSLST